MTQSRRLRLRPAIAIAVAAVVAAARAARWSPARVAGDSMEPTLVSGSLLAVAPVRGSLPRGAVVLIRRPDGSEHLKRLAGLPGDRLSLQPGREIALGPDEFAVLGDNPARSTDSRDYGPVAGEQIVAIARVCYWPPRRWRVLCP